MCVWAENRLDRRIVCPITLHRRPMQLRLLDRGLHFSPTAHCGHRTPVKVTAFQHYTGTSQGQWTIQISTGSPKGTLAHSKACLLGLQRFFCSYSNFVLLSTLVFKQSKKPQEVQTQQWAFRGWITWEHTGWTFKHSCWSHNSLGRAPRQKAQFGISLLWQVHGFPSKQLMFQAPKALPPHRPTYLGLSH